jgi:hypothetical protein
MEVTMPVHVTQSLQHLKKPIAYFWFKEKFLLFFHYTGKDYTPAEGSPIENYKNECEPVKTKVPLFQS